MARTRFSTTDLQELEGQLKRWRRSGRGRRRIPEEVWAAAVELARSQGPSRVARCLRLDYYKLQRKASGSVRPSRSSSATSCPEGFVELPWRGCVSAALGCRVELRGRQGDTMTVHLPMDSAAMVALAEAFWRRS
ncbi:MAG: hypothetical protein FJ387_26770 [Verrucomicrobia bacterium]|nr:hypothetical protein [Verrucomicrobiota bacterium]